MKENWLSEEGEEPVIIERKDFTEQEYTVICKAFGIESIPEAMILREGYFLEELYKGEETWTET